MTENWEIFNKAMTLLEDVPGETLLERVAKLKEWYLGLQTMVTAPAQAPVTGGKLTFGVLVENIAASDRNPIKRGIFIRKTSAKMAEYATKEGCHSTPLDNLRAAPLVPSTEAPAQAPAVLAEDFGHWLFMDCEQAVYDCGGLAEEILKYFDVRPREGLAVSSTERDTPPLPATMRCEHGHLDGCTICHMWASLPRPHHSPTEKFEGGQ